MARFHRVISGLSLLVSAVAFGQDLSVHVTYKTVAAPARQAIADLAKISHQDLRIDNELGNQPLILRLNDVSLKDAMDRIGAVLHAGWFRDRTQFTLQRTDDMTAKLQQDEVQKRLDQ